MNQDFKLGMHPDADQLSVFVEGAASSWEQERMLAHLAECAECRNAVFSMQPHEETQPATRTPVKGWVWGRLLPVGLPAAALACGLVAALIYIRPHGGGPGTPQQIASVKQPRHPSPLKQRLRQPPTRRSLAIWNSQRRRAGEQSCRAGELETAYGESAQFNERASGAQMPRLRRQRAR